MQGYARPYKHEYNNVAKPIKFDEENGTGWSQHEGKEWTYTKIEITNQQTCIEAVVMLLVGKSVVYR